MEGDSVKTLTREREGERRARERERDGRARGREKLER